MRLAVLHSGLVLGSGGSNSTDAVQLRVLPFLRSHVESLELIAPLRKGVPTAGGLSLEGISVHGLRPGGDDFQAYVGLIPEQLADFERLLERQAHRWDVLLVWGPTPFHLVAGAEARRRGILVVLRITGRHDLAFWMAHRRDTPVRRLAALTYRWIVDAGTRVIAPHFPVISDSDLGFLGGYGIVRGQARVFCVDSIQPAQSLREAAASAKSLASPPRRPRVTVVTRVAPQKGLLTLVEAVQLLARRGRFIKVKVVGPTAGDGLGGFEHRLRDAIGRAGLSDQIELTGAVPFETLEAIYRDTEILVVPVESEADGTPKVVMEGLSWACAIVASRVGGIPRVLKDGQTGLLVEPRDPKALYAALLRLLDRPILIRELGRAALNASPQFVAETAAARFVSALAEVAEGSRPGARAILNHAEH